MVMAAAGIVLIPGAPLGLITTSVQALAGGFFPAQRDGFLLLLCNDREVLGPWSNPRWLNVIASVIIGVLVELSLILMASTMFPALNVTDIFIYLSLALLLGFAGMAVYAVRNRPVAAASELVQVPEGAAQHLDDATASAPLQRPVWSPGRKTGMLVLRGYLVVAVLLVIVKTVQLGH